MPLQRVEAGPGSIGTFQPWEIAMELRDAPRDPFEPDQARLAWRTPGGQTREAGAFCDSPDGRVFRARILPTEPGSHSWALLDSEGGVLAQGGFEAQPSGRPGLVRAEGWRFVWSATGAPFFHNSTTAYMLAGLSENRIVQALTRLAEYRVDRVRVALSPARQPHGGRWHEPQVAERSDFTFRYAPWPVRNPGSTEDPQFDTARFDIAYWRKFERLLRTAESLGIVVQVVFYLDGAEPQNYPFDRDQAGDDPWESRYFRYAVDRLAAFPNVEWCVTNEWALFRPDEWVERMGGALAERDPYGHLASVHGHGHFPFRSSPWCTHALFQCWDEHGAHPFLMRARREQEASGVAKPQVNEEFGYEDHYAVWGEGRRAPTRDWASRLRLAWEMRMAGAYCTTGESAKDGSGGWINGLRLADSELLEGHRRMRGFFETMDWSRMEPCEVSGHAYALRGPSEEWAVYGYGEGWTAVPLPRPGPWDVDRFDPWTGRWEVLGRSATLERDPWTGPGVVLPTLHAGRTVAYRIRPSASG
ncbi:MAG: DUF4038 domain-containing protein [Fimbriimonadales bacterium]|nr:DUF4038 domain-containing protein [Fimbriimonadales bacterium]